MFDHLFLQGKEQPHVLAHPYFPAAHAGEISTAQRHLRNVWARLPHASTDGNGPLVEPFADIAIIREIEFLRAAETERGIPPGAYIFKDNSPKLADFFKSLAQPEAPKSGRGSLMRLLKSFIPGKKL